MPPAAQTSGSPRPDLIVLDVNQTLSDLSPLGDAFAEVGLDPEDVDLWFAGVLRDGFALAVLGDNPTFAEVGAALLRVRLAAVGSANPDAAAQQVIDRFAQLDPHPDVVPGLLALSEAGCRIVTLSNGSAAVARSLLEKSEAGPVVEAYLTVADAGAWKPATQAYAHALAETSVPAERAMLVAVHPWDLEGARRAGLRTAWLNRTGGAYPDHFARADVEVESMVALAEHLTG